MKRARPKNIKRAQKRCVLVLVILICVSASVICKKLFWRGNTAEPVETETNQQTDLDTQDADIAESSLENEEAGLDYEYFSYIYSLD